MLSRGLILLALPVLLGTLLLTGLPLLATIGLSLFRVDALQPAQYVGLEHFRALLHDPLFLQALRNSALLLMMALPLRLGLSLLLSLLLAGSSRLSHIGLGLSLAPLVLPTLVWSIAWLWLLNPYAGPAASLLEAFHPQGADWILSPHGARTAIVLVISLIVGEMVLVLRAVRRMIPAHYYQTAAVEGASTWFAFRHITWPQLRPIIALLSLRDLSLSLQWTLVPALIVTKTGPLHATLYLPYYGYQNAFEYLRFGYAAAIALPMVLLVIAALALQGWLLWRWRQH
nr:sugar ABC transporter permease [Oceanococcus sp. HetDA_MAG_MS8]